MNNGFFLFRVKGPAGNSQTFSIDPSLSLLQLKNRVAELFHIYTEPFELLSVFLRWFLHIFLYLIISRFLCLIRDIHHNLCCAMIKLLEMSWNPVVLWLLLWSMGIPVLLELIQVTPIKQLKQVIVERTMRKIISDLFQLLTQVNEIVASKYQHLLRTILQNI